MTSSIEVIIIASFGSVWFVILVSLVYYLYRRRRNQLPLNNHEFMQMARQRQLSDEEAENEAKRIEATKKRVHLHIQSIMAKKRFDELTETLSKDD